jgi:hypothetical protein
VNSKTHADPPRSVKEITKKYQALKSEVKGLAAKRKREMNQTGGGQIEDEEPLSEVQEVMLQIIPLVEINGINGGIDISKGNDKCFLCVPVLILILQSSPVNATTVDVDTVRAMTSTSVVPLAKPPEPSRASTSVAHVQPAKHATPEDAASSSRSSEENEKIKRPMKRGPETTLYALQDKQVRLLEGQTRELRRIGDLMQERNEIEEKKLNLMMREKYVSSLD